MQVLNADSECPYLESLLIHIFNKPIAPPLVAIKQSFEIKQIRFSLKRLTIHPASTLEAGKNGTIIYRIRPPIMKCQFVSSAVCFGLISVASAVWPIPSEYAHGDKVLWIEPSLQFNYTLVGVVRPLFPSPERESKHKSLTNICPTRTQLHCLPHT